MLYCSVGSCVGIALVDCILPFRGGCSIESFSTLETLDITCDDVEQGDWQGSEFVFAGRSITGMATL